MSELTKDQLKALGISTPQQAVSSAMEKMTSPVDIYSLSRTDTPKERSQILLAKSIGDNIPAFSFLSVYAQDRLLLNLSDAKATGRTGLIEMIKSPVVALGSDMKQGIKNFLDAGK